MPEIYTDLIDAASRLRATFESGIWCEMSFGVVPVRCVVCSRTVRPRPRLDAARHQLSRGNFELKLRRDASKFPYLRFSSSPVHYSKSKAHIANIYGDTIDKEILHGYSYMKGYPVKKAIFY